jgi:hypothetical protein
MTYDLLVLNGKLVSPEYSREQDIAVEGEKIVAFPSFRVGFGPSAEMKPIIKFSPCRRPG